MNECYSFNQFKAVLLREATGMSYAQESILEAIMDHEELNKRFIVSFDDILLPEAVTDLAQEHMICLTKFYIVTKIVKCS